MFGVVGSNTAVRSVFLVDEGGELLNAVTFIVPVLRSSARRSTTGLGGHPFAVLSLTAVLMLPVVLALLGTGARCPTLAFRGLVRLRGRDDRLRWHPHRRVNFPHQPHRLAVVATIGISVSRRAHCPAADGQLRALACVAPRERLPRMESVPGPPPVAQAPTPAVSGRPPGERVPGADERRRGILVVPRE